MSFQDLKASGGQRTGRTLGPLAPSSGASTQSRATSVSSASPAKSESRVTPATRQPPSPAGSAPPSSASAARYGTASAYQGDRGPSGLGPTSSSAGTPTSDPDVVTGVFQMNTAVSTFKRLVNSLGTPKDTPELRQKLHKSRQYVTQLAKETSSKLKEASERDHVAGVSTAKKLSDAKLAKDFQAVLREFEKAQHLAAERESAYAPHDPAAAAAAGPQGGRRPPAGAARRRYGLDAASTAEAPSDPLLAERQRQELLTVESELTYTEAVIEEREQGIQEIQQQIVEVNEIFRDLAVLVKEQGVFIDDIEANIENTHAQTVQANKQLMKAARTQRDSNSFICWVMGVFAVGLFIFFLVMSS